MSTPFDGMAAALNGVFGAAVTLVNLSAVSTTVQAVFRDMPVEVDNGDGRPVVIIVPTLKVPKTLAPTIAAGWQVSPAAVSPRTFKVLRVEPSSSPAADRFLHCVLEEV